jgi:hypothetical protein
MLEPHIIPFDWLSTSVHTGAPVVHEIMPVRHGLPGTAQDVPATHAAHAPSLHTMPAPQGVPFDCGFCVSVHVAAAAPAPHAVSPTWQGLAAAHAEPFVHMGVSEPPSETTLVLPSSLGPPMPAAASPPLAPAAASPFLPAAPPSPGESGSLRSAQPLAADPSTKPNVKQLNKRSDITLSISIFKT